MRSLSTPLRTRTQDDTGMIDVALALAALCIVVLFSFYVLSVTATSARYQQALSESLRNLSREIQENRTPLSAAEVATMANATLNAVGVPANSLVATVAMTGSCNAEFVTLSIANPLLPTGRITGSTTQVVSLDTGCI